jgi:hypothetical protein
MTSTTNSSFSTDTLFSSVSSQPTGATTSTIPSISVQPTGGTGLGTFTGLKTFKPSSSFGASLLESLPPIPGSGPTTPSATSENQGQIGQGQPGTSGLSFGSGYQSQPNGLGSTPGGSGLNVQPTGLGALNTQQPLTTGLGGGLGMGLGTNGLGSNLSTTTGTGAGGVGIGSGPQMTGIQGVANPFRTTMFSSNTSNPGLGLGGGLGGTPFGQNQITQSQPQQRQGSLI